jgi:hypothetical protein
MLSSEMITLSSRQTIIIDADLSSKQTMTSMKIIQPEDNTNVDINVYNRILQYHCVYSTYVLTMFEKGRGAVIASIGKV